MKSLKLFTAALLFAFAFNSCVKEEIEVKDFNYGIQPEFGVPIANVTILAASLIENFDDEGLVSVGDNGSISLIYRDTLDPLSAGELLDIEHQEYNDTINLSSIEFNELIDLGSVTVQGVESYEFESNEGDRLDSITFETGLLGLNIATDGSFPISGYFKIINADNTEAITLNFSDGVPPISIEDQVSFEDLRILFTNNASTSNGLTIEYEITLTSEGSGSSAPIYFDVFITDFSMKNAGGYIAPRIIDLDNETISIALFDDPSTTGVILEDPRINLNFENEFGLGLGLEIYELIGTNVNNETLTVSGSNISQLSPISAAPQNGEVAYSTLTIDNDLMTPTVTDFLSFGPNNLMADLGLSINPEDSQNAFVTNENELRINFELEVPVYGSISDFELIDTAALDLGDLITDVEDISEIEALDVRLIIDNGFPFDAGVQIVFTDFVFNQIDVLFENPDLIYASAPVNLSVSPDDPEYGRAVGKTRTITDISIPKSKILGLENATQMIITIYGNSAGNGDHPIRLFSNDAFDVKLGAKATLNFSNDE